MIVALVFFHDLSFGTLPPGASRHMTAAATLTTAAGGEAKAFISVKLFWTNFNNTSLFSLSKN
jgi:hypothetical protein